MSIVPYTSLSQKERELHTIFKSFYRLPVQRLEFPESAQQALPVFAVAARSVVWAHQGLVARLARPLVAPERYRARRDCQCPDVAPTHLESGRPSLQDNCVDRY